MKPGLTLILLALFVWIMPPCASGAQRYVQPVGLFGRSYVPLSDWARANNFEIHWLKHDETVQLSNRTARMLFNVDSREAQINGTNVRLCFPVVLRNGSPWLASLDAEVTLKPLLYPPRNSARSKIKTIVLDPGHGGREPGFQVGSYQEKKYTLLLAEELGDQLKRAGFNVSLTRTTDTQLDLPLRPDIARRRAADLFISLHWNSVAVGRNEVKGAQTYCLTPAGAPSSSADSDAGGGGINPGNRFNDRNLYLAYLVQTSLHKNLGVEDRGVHRARFWVLRDAQMPAILIEGGFMSHPAESKRIFDPAYRKQMSRAIVEAVQAYKAQVERVR